MILKEEAISGGLEVSGELRIDTAAELCDALKVCLEHQAEVVVDLSQVSGCDVAGLQVLLAAQKSAVTGGKRFRVNGVPSAVRETAAALGLDLDQALKTPGMVTRAA